MIQKLLRLIVCACIIVSSQLSIFNYAQAQTEWLPAKSNRLVNDYSGILTAQQVQALEQRLVAFNDSTSNQVLIVITPTIEGNDEDAAAQRIGQAWGVGQAEFDNGVVILIKSKTEEENWGAVAIATGYGVEGALPDLFCKRIIENHMIGALGDGDYYKAITQALDVIEPVCRGEYSYADYRKEEQRALWFLLGFMLIIVVVLLLAHRYDKKLSLTESLRIGSEIHRCILYSFTNLFSGIDAAAVFFHAFLVDVEAYDINVFSKLHSNRHAYITEAYKCQFFFS